MKQIIAFLFIWLLLAAIGGGIGFWVFNPSETEQFTKTGVGIYGKVTGTEPDNHRLVKYSYEVNGKKYTGDGYAGRGNPNFEQIQVGREVIIYYDAEAPEKSILGYPQLYNSANKSGILFSAIFFPVFPMIIIFSVYWGTRRLNKQL